MTMENKIIVIYVGIAGVRSEDVSGYVSKVTKRITPESIKAEFIVIPIESTTDTRMECINPIYVTEDVLMKKHTDLMMEVDKLLQDDINRIKNEKKNRE